MLEPLRSLRIHMIGTLYTLGPAGTGPAADARLVGSSGHAGEQTPEEERNVDRDTIPGIIPPTTFPGSPLTPK